MGHYAPMGDGENTTAIRQSDVGKFRPHSSHWGAFEAAEQPDGTIAVRAHSLDTEPPDLHGNLASAQFHESRIGRPMVRRGWLDDGPGPDPRRGSDAHVGVGWDEVLDRLAAELDRVRTEHGNQAIYGGSYGWASAGRFHHAQSQVHRFLNAIGGYVRSVNSYSNGCSAVLLPHVVGDALGVLRQGPTWNEILDEGELVVAFGGLADKNLSVTPGGQTRHSNAATAQAIGRSRVEVISFSPLRDDAPAEMDAQWQPIRPGTDVAVMAALGYVLLDEGLADGEFLDRYCVGADRLAAYLRGDVDGEPKTPEWAEEISGVAASDLRNLARRMAAGRTLVTVAWSLQRIRFGEQPVWMGIALASLLGQIGLPGGGFGHGHGSMADTGAPWMSSWFPSVPQGDNPVELFIPVARVTDLLLRETDTFDYDGATHVYPDTRLVYWCGGNPFHHHQDLNRLRRGLAQLDTLVVHEPYWTATARHADIVLPATTTLERNDIGSGRKDPILMAMHQVVAPYGEARNDHDIFAGLADRLGVGNEFRGGMDEMGWLRSFYATWLDRLGDLAAEVPTFDEFWERGWADIPTVERTKKPTLFSEFRSDPGGAPLRTPSGRIELWSETVAGFGYADCPGHPSWLEPDDWLGGPAARRFPLHLIANQPAGRLHGQHDMGEVSLATKIAGREPVRMHPDDASERGLVDGDVVRVFNDRGACLAGLVVTDAVMPRVVQLATGAWYDPLDPADDESICVHGNPNVLTTDIGTSRLAQGCTGQHCLVQIEPFPGDPPPVRAHTPPPADP